MPQLRKRAVKTRLLVFFVAAIGPLYASRLNPVSWSLEAEQQEVSPGSTVMLRLHAQIADGYHLYSFTTPSGGPIKTGAWLPSSPDIKGVRVYQPNPDRHQDPNLNVPVETFRSGVDFLLSLALANNASAGDKVVTASVRYQACSDQICLPPVTKMAATSIRVEPGAEAATVSIPSDYQLVGGSGSDATTRQRQTAKPSTDLHFVPLQDFIKLISLGDQRSYQKELSYILDLYSIADEARPSHFMKLIILRLFTPNRLSRPKRFESFRISNKASEGWAV
ncbi:MAG TPA: protein-disulfide reductase DsbD N-terminal domain-containing protein [Bryobacteraceae bacterium]|nr:protein-disulfide reductase DsbD N-terminal domain-containing protein [Bryobacteraceae bacterium]